MRQYCLLALSIGLVTLVRAIPTDTLRFPTHNSTQVPSNVRLQIYFNENIQKGSVGNVRIFDASSSSQIFFIPVSCNCISVIGNKAEILLPAPLSFNQTVYVLVASGTFKNFAGENFAGFNTPFDWRFTIANGLVTHQNFNPLPNTLCLSLRYSTFQLILSANVMATPSGKIRIFEKSTHLLHELIPVQSSRVIISGNVVSFSINRELAPFTEYYVTVDPASFQTATGAVYEGIYDSSVWSFRTTLQKPQDDTRLLSICGQGSVLLKVTHPIATHFRWYREDTLLVSPSGQPFVGDSLRISVVRNTVFQVSAWHAGCESEKIAITVTVKPLPTPTLPPEEIRVGRNIPFTLEANGGVSYQWQPVVGLSNPNAAVTQAVVNENTVFRVTITNADGCSVVRMVQIIVDDSEKDFFLPTLFTPNNDGVHDVLRVKGKNIAEIEWSIYDRNGKLLYRTQNVQEAMNIGWDGTFQGVPQPQDTYIWTVQGKFSDGTPLPQKVGSVILLR